MKLPEEDPKKDWRKQGLVRKYTLTKADGSPVDPDRFYFILNVSKDVHAQNALRTYIVSVARENMQLASDLLEQLWDAIQKQFPTRVRHCTECHKTILMNTWKQGTDQTVAVYSHLDGTQCEVKLVE